ncbi:MAG: cysteine desulfurase [Chloroflexota bacterium]
MDVEAVRRDFPILQRTVRNGKRLVYLDNAATSQKPRAVIEALKHYYEYYNANVHRGVHTLAEEATEAYEGARAKVAKFINAPSPSSVVFVRNTTEAINLVAYAYARRELKPGDEILLSIMEHHSNLVPWQLVAQETGAELRFLDITQDYRLDLSQLDRLLSRRTRVVALTLMSNVLGTINPIKEVARAAHEVGAVMVVDAAQAAPHMPIDVQALDADFLALSGHKMCAPTGIGALYGKPELLERMGPFLGGGSMIRDVHLTYAEWNEVPWKFEAGTPNIGDAVALGVAVDYLQGLGMENVRRHEKELLAYALRRLAEVEGLEIYGPKDPEVQGGIISFNYLGVHPHDVGTVLDSEGVAIRAGHHCAKPLMRRLGVVATARASFYIYNTKAEVDAFIEALAKVREIFSRVP